MAAKNSGFIRFTGFLLGCALAVGLVLSGRVPEGQAGSPASLTISSKPTTELGVSPAGELLSERNLKPGGRQAHATIRLANFTARPLPVRLRVASERAGPRPDPADRARHRRGARVPGQARRAAVLEQAAAEARAEAEATGRGPGVDPGVRS